MNASQATRAGWSDAQRDEAYTRLCHAVSAAAESPQGEALFLARLALLLAEEVGDLPRVLGAIEAAGSKR